MASKFPLEAIFIKLFKFEFCLFFINFVPIIKNTFRWNIILKVLNKNGNHIG